MKLEIYARNADDHIKARRIVTRCLPSNVFGLVYINLHNKGKEYGIAYKIKGGYTTFGIDMNNERLTK